MRRVQQAAHGLHLVEAGFVQGIFQHKGIHGFASNVFFHNAFRFGVNIQHTRHRNADFLQVVVIPQFGFELIAKLVIDAGFMVNLLNHDLLPVRHLCQVRIPAFALAQQFEQGVGIAIYQNCFRHKSTLLVG